MPFISASAQVTLLDPTHFFVFSLEDASAPGISIEAIAPPQPYGNPIQVTFTTNVTQNHVYTVKVWESVDNTPTGVVRCGYSVTVTINSVSVRLPIYAEVDITAGWVSNTDTVVDATLVGWDYILRVNPYYLVPDSETNTNPAYTKNTDGFTLLNGVLLQPNEQYIIEFIPQIIVSAPGTPSAPIATGRTITADEVLTSADVNAGLIIASATSTIKITLPDSTTTPDWTSFMYLISQGGGHKNVQVFTQGADTILYNGAALSETYLGQSETLIAFPFNKNWFVISELPGVKTVGSYLYSDSILLNYALCNGQLLNRQEYPMLWAYVQSQGAVTDIIWNSFTTVDSQTYYPNKGYFSLGDGVTNFRLPLLTDTVLKGTATVPGAGENHMSVDHSHATLHSASGTGGGTGYVGGSAGVLDPTQNSTGPAKVVGTGATNLSLVGSEVRIKTRLKYILIRY